MPASARSTLAASGGDCWILSAARQTFGFFYELWRQAGAEWSRACVTATNCPRISGRFLAARSDETIDRMFNSRG